MKLPLSRVLLKNFSVRPFLCLYSLSDLLRPSSPSTHKQFTHSGLVGRLDVPSQTNPTPCLPPLPGVLVLHPLRFPGSLGCGSSASVPFTVLSRLHLLSRELPPPRGDGRGTLCTRLSRTPDSSHTDRHGQVPDLGS